MKSSPVPGDEKSAGLPTAPQIAPKIQFSRKKMIGFPLIIAIPILALFGVFGERSSSTRTSNASLDMSVAYPERLHYRQVLPLRVSVRNLSPNTIDSLSVTFDTAYIAHFSSVQFDPPLRAAYEVDLSNIKPSESRIVSVELWGQDYGRHRGTVIARTGADSVVARFTTIVFP
ncbi:MAG: hypothetical protein ACREMS_00375 [Gemmatimonadaceae bacterium]